MLGTVVKTETNTIYQFEIGNEKYVYLNQPLMASSCTGSEETWSGMTNFFTTSPPDKTIRDIDHAFEMLRWWKKNEKGYRYGVIKDFETKTVYYDDGAVLVDLKERFPNQFEFLVNRIKIEDWQKP